MDAAAALAIGAPNFPPATLPRIAASTKTTRQSFAAERRHAYAFSLAVWPDGDDFFPWPGGRPAAGDRRPAAAGRLAPGSVWPSEPPAGCPFPPSETLKCLRFSGRHAEYGGADTWYPSWAADGNMYSPWTDGEVNGVKSNSYGGNPTTGHAAILGDDPMKLRIVNAGVFKGDPSPYEGRYPCGSLVYNGVWYYGTYCLKAPFEEHDGILYNWPWLGPFVGFRYSTDFGKTWTDTPCTPAKPLFGERALKGEPIKIGSPHVVDFGRNMEHSPDGKAYFVAHGASDGKNRRFGYDSWGTGDEIYLFRTTPSIENINDASKYEFFAGRDAAGAAVWSHDFAKIKPVAVWRDNMGCATMTYDAPLKKYILCVLDAGKTIGYFNTYLLESDQITGPWKLLTYMKRFGEQAYFVNIPSKFIGRDGRTLWLCYANNFTIDGGQVRIRNRPAGAHYCMSLQEVNILAPGDPAPPPSPPPSPLDGEDNLAWKRGTVATASSTSEGYSPQGAVDGLVGGAPNHPEQEWASRGEKDTAMIRLNWGAPQKIDRVWLFDRPNEKDQATSSLLVFSDGTTIPVGPLPNDAKKGIEVKFTPKTVKWVAVFITGVSPTTQNAGLSEIAVFRAAK